MKFIKLIPYVFVIVLTMSCENESFDSQVQNEEISNTKVEESLSERRGCNIQALRNQVRYRLKFTNRDGEVKFYRVPKRSLLVVGENTSLSIELRDILSRNFLRSGLKSIEFVSLDPLPIGAALISQPGSFNRSTDLVDVFDPNEIEVSRGATFSLVTTVPRSFDNRNISLFYQLLIDCRGL